MVKARKRKDREGWQVDIRGMLPDGTRYRERIKPPVTAYTAAVRWGEQRERAILAGETKQTKEVPTLSAFKDRFLEHGRANRQKASTIYARESILRKHLVPALGTRRLDEITDADIQALKVRMAEHSPKTVNNVLATLSKLLRVAKRLKVIDALPVESFDLLKVAPPAVAFYTFEEYGDLVAAAARHDPRTLAAVLLGGDAGLRSGEVIGLELPDVSRANRLVTVERQVWRGVVDSPKGGKGRSIPMTERLAAALAAVRHLRGDRVLLQDDGAPLTAKVLRGWVKSAQRLAGLKPTGNFHVLRHTFCSHLAMRGAPARVIQELAGHVQLSTTMRYMHLAPGHKEQAIRLLDSGAPSGHQASAKEKGPGVTGP